MVLLLGPRLSRLVQAEGFPLLTRGDSEGSPSNTRQGDFHILDTVTETSLIVHWGAWTPHGFAGRAPLSTEKFVFD